MGGLPTPLVYPCLIRTHRNLFGAAPSAWKLWIVGACDVGDTTTRARSWVEMASSMRTDKEVFFRRLDEIDELALDTDGEVTSEHALKVRRLYYFNTLHCKHTSREQEIINSEVRPTPSTITELGPNAPLSEVIIMPAQPSNRRTVSGKAPPKLSKKQSSKKSIQLQPEDAQIFRGLVFCEFIMSLVHITSI